MIESEPGSKEKIKVVIVSNDFLVGGVQKLVLDQLDLLDHDKFQFYLIILSQFPGKGDFYHLLPKDVPVYKLNFKRLLDFGEWIRLYKILREINPKVVKTSLFMSNFILRILKLFFSYQVIIAEHNTEIYRPFRYKFFDWLLSFFTYKIVADSKTVASFVSRSEFISSRKFQVIYNGVEIDEINKFYQENISKKNVWRQELGLCEGDKVFLNIARITTQKNHRLMVEAFSSLCEERDNVKLIIIGDGTLFPDLKKWVEDSGHKDKIFILGERLDLFRFYLIADYFLLTSVREGFCISAMMGLAFGLPVVSTKVAGLIEYIDDGYNGLLTEHNRDSVISKMREIVDLNQSTLDTWRENSRKTALAFGIKKYGQTYDKLFIESAKKKN